MSSRSNQVADQVGSTQSRRDLDGARQSDDLCLDRFSRRKRVEHVRVGRRDALAFDALQAV
jgi:hypothetical protein